MKFRSLAIGTAALLLPFGVVACGQGDDDNDSGSRPTVSEISEQLEELGGAAMPATFIDCFANELHDSDLPNGVLRKFIAGEDAEVDKDNEDTYNDITTDAQTKCTEEAMEAPAE